MGSLVPFARSWVGSAPSESLGQKLISAAAGLVFLVVVLVALSNL